MFMPPYNQAGDCTPADPYTNDIARKLSVSGSSSEDVIASLRNMNLGDNFWMYSFKVVPCAKTFSHKWTLCPCGHAGETARRRDPRFHMYRAVLCPLVKVKKSCPMGDNCMWSHNVFEHWLHPSRYKTRLCSFGRNCNRPICFFAHSAEELRCVPNADDGKELDEREYLMQLMMAQEAGMLPAGTVQDFAQPNAQVSTMPTPMDNSMLMNMHRGSNSGSSHHQMQNSQRAQAPARPDRATATVASSQPQQQSAGLDAASLFFGLQESLANMSVPGRDTATAAGWSGPHAKPTRPYPSNEVPHRISDPGQGTHMLNAAAINPIRHLNRISDSGQTLSVLGPRGMADLETLLNSALAAMPGNSSPPASPPVQQSPPPKKQSSPPLTGSPSTSSASCQLQFLSASLAGPSEIAPPPGYRRSSSSSGAVAAAPAAPNSADSYVRDLVAQLQEQGIVNSKEQLVASLSQLLAQLLVN